MTNQLIVTHELRTEDVDLACRLTVPGLTSLFQRMTTYHGLELGVDYQTLLEKSNAYWVVARIRLLFTGEARFGDKVTACTWPLPPSRASFDREMTVTAADGTPVASVSSEWCVLDRDTHRLRKADTTCFPMDLNFREEMAGAGAFLRLGHKIEGMAPCFSHTVRYSDLDMNRHTNNVVYTRLAMDTFSATQLEAQPPKWFEIRFLKESHEGDVLHLYREEQADGVHIVGAKEDGTAVFSACVGF